MDQTIKVDLTLASELKVKRKLQKVYENDASHFVKGNFRASVFNIKTLLSKKVRKDEILYLPLNIPSMIGTGFADFIVWDGIDIEIDNEEIQKKRNEIEERNDFDEVLYNMAIEQSVYGYANCRIRKDDEDEIVIEQVPFTQYRPALDGMYLWESLNKIYIISLKSWSLTEATNSALVQQYEKMDNGKWTVSVWVYTFSGAGDLIEMQFKEEKKSEVMDFLNIYTVQNKKLWDKHLWESDFTDCIDYIEDVNDRMTQISFQFIKHLNSKMSLPEGISKFISKEDKTVPDLDVYVHRQGEQPAMYIENTNSLISEARDHINTLLRIISALTQSHPSFVWLDEWWWVEKVEALKIKLLRFLNKVRRKRSRFENMIKKLVKDAIVWSGEKKEFSIEVKFNDDMLKDTEGMFDRYMKLYDAWLLSKQTTIGYTMDRDEAAVESEIEKIDEEKQQEMEDMPPALTDQWQPNGWQPWDKWKDALPTNQNTNGNNQ